MCCYHIYPLPLLIFVFLSACTSLPNKKTNHIKHMQPAFTRAHYYSFDDAHYDQNEILLRAMGLIGIPYRLGGNSPEEGFDCSGLINYVFFQSHKYRLPRTIAQLSQQGIPVKYQEMIPGDLVFFRINRKKLSHAGIYLGDKKFIHAPTTGGQIRIENLSTTYWASRFDHARRLNKKMVVTQP